MPEVPVRSVVGLRRRRRAKVAKKDKHEQSHIGAVEWLVQAGGNSNRQSVPWNGCRPSLGRGEGVFRVLESR